MSRDTGRWSKHSCSPERSVHVFSYLVTDLFERVGVVTPDLDLKSRVRDHTLE